MSTSSCREPLAVSRRRTSRPDLLAARVLSVIQSRGPITARAIADAIPILTTDAERLVRQKVRNLVMSGEPIASTVAPPYGYTLVQPGSAEAAAYVDQLRGRLEHTAQRLARFRSASAARIQGVLFEEFGPSVNRSDRSYRSYSDSQEAKCQE